MNRNPRLIFILGFLAILPTSGLGQGFSVEARKLPSIANVAPDAPFTSHNGRFVIALPQQISGFGPVAQQTPKGKITGESFTWATAEGTFRVLYGDYAEPLSNEGIAVLLGQLRDALAQSTAAKQGKLLNTRPLSLTDMQGIEVVLEQAGTKGILRIYVVGKRLYQLLATFPKEKTQGESAVVKALDSFRLLSEEQIQAALRKKLEEAAPAPLPQEPVAPKLKSDAEDDGLKGRVKLIESEDQDLSGTWTVQTRKLSDIKYYDRRGNLTKRESWDYQGNPSDITVYGYLDGARVSNSGYVRYEYDPPPAMAPPPPPGQATLKRDSRYAFKFTYKYDDKGRLAERVMFSNDGKLWQRRVLTYEKQQQESLYYSEDGQLNSKSIEKFDEKGSVIESESWDVATEKIRDRYAYQYEVDAQGNWIKRTTLKWTTKDGKSSFVPSYTTWRKITYYEN
jgi:hypothetical protein